MIKRTLFFSNPVYLKRKDNQLVALQEDEEIVSAPIEDVGFLVLDNPRISYSQSLIVKLLENNVCVIYCNDKHMPAGMLLNLESHHLQHELHRTQVDAKLTLKKSLWKHIVERKIKNQMTVAEMHSQKIPAQMARAYQEVRSDDSTNREAVAARSYWKTIMPAGFSRSNRDLLANKMLNYGYAILRAAVARSLTGSGLLPTLGIHHRNQYNSYALADDIMEPYRPFVDHQILNTVNKKEILETKDLNKTHKKLLLEVLTHDTFFPGKKRPLTNALSLTSASLARHFQVKTEKVVYPRIK